MNILLAAVFSFLITSWAWATPQPPPKPYELTLAHADHLVSMIELRLGFSSRGASSQSDWAKLVPWVRLNAYKVPLWVTELNTDEIAASVDSFVRCGSFASKLPPERPTEVIAVACGDMTFQLPRSPKVLVQRRLFYITERTANSLSGKVWTAESGFSRTYQFPIRARQAAQR